MSLLDSIPEGLDDVIKSVLTETDADVIKFAIGAVALGTSVFAAYKAVKYAIDKDKVKDLSELVTASTGMVEAITPGKKLIDAIIEK